MEVKEGGRNGEQFCRSVIELSRTIVCWEINAFSLRIHLRLGELLFAIFSAQHSEWDTDLEDHLHLCVDDSALIRLPYQRPGDDRAASSPLPWAAVTLHPTSCARPIKLIG